MTEPKILPEDLTSLDFPLICEVEETYTGEIVHCDKPAAWIGTTPCGHDSYFCEQHRVDQRAFTCLRCWRKNLRTSTYTWIRL